MNIKRFTLKLFGINTYIVWDKTTKNCAIIDPGMIDKEECDKIDCFIKNNELIPTHLIYTHTHIDHVSGTRHIIDKYGLRPEGNISDNYLAEDVKKQAKLFGLPTEIFDNFKIECNLVHGNIVKIGNEVLEVIQVPGHSKGSIALYDKECNWVITGDALFEQSIGRTDLPGGDLSQLISSIQTNLLTLPENTIVYPGHGSDTTIGAESKWNPFLK